uniref:Amine oxidase domain-containing protein n=1 Tax=Arion vulgaris TaxID=1028688 RepID=A0A0B7B8V7_9EUPU
MLGDHDYLHVDLTRANYKLLDLRAQVAVGEPSKAKLYPMKAGPGFYQNLIDQFPTEKDAILKYRDLVQDAAGSFISVVILKLLPRRLVSFLVKTGLPRLVMTFFRKGYATRTVQEVLDELTNNQELKLVLCYIYGDYGLAPRDAPFALHAAIVAHYQDGAYYPVNGSSEIAYHMIKEIHKGGGKVLVQSSVSQILCDSDGTAVGVRVGKNELDIHAKYIISNAGVVNTFQKLLPEKVAKASNVYPLIEKVGQSYAFITAFIGVEGSAAELNLPEGNIWWHDGQDINTLLDSYLNLRADELESANIPFAFISFPSSKDPEWDKKFPGKSSILSVTLAKWDWFKEWKDEKLRHRGDRYEDLKDLFGKKMWQQCVDLFPLIDGKKVYMEVGTPVTNQHYLACPKGEMYGLDQRASRFSLEVIGTLRQDTDIKGLYMTGQDTFSCGFIGAFVSGVFCTSKILNRDVYEDLNQLTKHITEDHSATNGVSHKKNE